MKKGFAFAVALAAGSIALSAVPAAAQTKIKFTLDWKIEGPAAGVVMADDKGYFKAEGLDVTIDTGNGSRESIPRVATGTYEMGFGDINALVKFLDEDPAQKVRAVMMVYDKPPFAIVGRKDKGVTDDPKSLEGKTLGAPPPDATFGQWPAFVAVNKLDTSAIRIENVGFPVREPMLAQGKVDAVFGFSFSIVTNLEAQGVPADNISTILMADHGLDLYGNVILVNTDFATAHPEAVKGFLRALAKGWADVVKDPDAGVKGVVARNGVASAETERERLDMVLAQNIKTPWVAANGFGGIDETRLARSIDFLKISMDLKRGLKPGDVFDSSYLAPKEERMLP